MATITHDETATDQQADAVRRDRQATPVVELAIRLAALGLLLYLALILVRPFISIVIWSVVIAVALYPGFDWMARQLGGRRRLAAVIITIVSLLVVIGPATWLVLGLVDSVRFVSQQFDVSTLVLPLPPLSVKSWPLFGDPIYDFWTLASTNLKAALAKVAPELRPFGSSVLRLAADTGTGMLKFIASIIIAGFLFAPGPKLVDGLKKLVHRLEATHGDEFVDLAGATIRTVSRGVVGIAVLQALLAGLGLMVAGVPATSLLTSGVLVLGIIQIGPALVIWSWFVMEPMAALLFTAYMIPVNLIDNVLRPLLMGRGLRVPLVVILIGVIGGTLASGITGLFLGPIVLSVIWEMAVAWVKDAEEA